MTIGERISNTRNELGYSQEDLAKKCGWSNRSSISHIESSGDHISLKKIQKVAKALGVDVAWLMGMEYSDKTISTIIEPIPNERFIKYKDRLNQAIEDKIDISEIEKILDEFSLSQLNRVSAYIDYLKLKKENEE